MAKSRPSYRVVLQVPGSYARASGVVFGRLAAAQLALDYWDNAADGDVICIYIPPDSRDIPDYKWIKGKHSVTGIYDQLKVK